MIYVTLPEEFVAIRYPGYFWHLGEQKLYSLKIGGELKPLKPQKYFINRRTLTYKCTTWDRINKLCYRVSVKGKRRTLFIDDLKNMEPKQSQIKVIYDR